MSSSSISAAQGGSRLLWLTLAAEQQWPRKDGTSHQLGTMDTTG